MFVLYGSMRVCCCFSFTLWRVTIIWSTCTFFGRFSFAFLNILQLNEYWKWRIWLIIRVRVVSNRWHNNAMTSYYHDVASSYRTEYRGSVVFLFSRESPRSGSSKLYSKHCSTILYRRHDCYYRYPCVDRRTEGNYEVFINFSWFLCFVQITHTRTPVP